MFITFLQFFSFSLQFFFLFHFIYLTTTWTARALTIVRIVLRRTNCAISVLVENWRRLNIRNIEIACRLAAVLGERARRLAQKLIVDNNVARKNRVLRERVREVARKFIARLNVEKYLKKIDLSFFLSCFLLLKLNRRRNEFHCHRLGRSRRHCPSRRCLPTCRLRKWRS